MATFFPLTILTPERNFFIGEARQVTFSTPEGRVGVMAGHMPMIASVADDILEIDLEDGRKVAAAGPGFVKIMDGKAEFYVDTAEWADEIDAARAREALERAELRLRSNLNRREFIQSQAAISRALTRLKAAKAGGIINAKRLQ